MHTFIGIGAQELLLLLVLAGLLFLFFLLPILALVEIIKSDFQAPNDKLIWVLVILFLNLIGAALYVFIGRKQRIA